MNKKYKATCARCEKITPHIVHIISRTRGHKLKCLGCGKIKAQYSKKPVEWNSRNNKTFYKVCSKCRVTTPNVIVLSSSPKAKGVKVRCLSCHHISKRYYSYEFLESQSSPQADKKRNKSMEDKTNGNNL